MSEGGSTLYSPDIDNILKQLKTELENIDEGDEPIEFEFGVVYLTQKDTDELEEFDGF